MSEDFINSLQSINSALSNNPKLRSDKSIQDYAETISSNITVSILIFAMFIMTFGTYMNENISCFIPTIVYGEEIEDFIEGYCMLSGTYNLPKSTPMPSNTDGWRSMEKYLLTYYAYIPLTLGIIGLLYYLPKAIGLLLYSSFDINIQKLFTLSNIGYGKGNVQGSIKALINTVKNALYNHLSEDNLTKTEKFYFKLKTGSIFYNFLVTKVLYIINCVFQMFLIAKIFGSTNSFVSFGFDLTHQVFGFDKFYDRLIFPRVTYCYLKGLKAFGYYFNNQLNFVGQCALPMNMINEKIFLFLWYWALFIGVLLIISFVKWVLKMNDNYSFIETMLKNEERNVEKEEIEKFVSQYLRINGCFILRLINIRAGRAVTGPVVSGLYDIYVEKIEKINERNMEKIPYHAEI